LSAKERAKRVTTREAYERLTAGKHSPERCLEAAFQFLLDREPKESILRRFDVTFTLLWFSGRSVFYRFDAYTLRHHRGPHDEAGRKAGCRKSACPVAISRYFPEFEREMPRYLSQF
jgi:hypothetical protein